jgi:hypothetical protein
MGMEDRDWYREKRIDWERGGLTARRGKKRPPKSVWWIGAAVIAAIALYLL